MGALPPHKIEDQIAEQLAAGGVLAELIPAAETIVEVVFQPCVVESAPHLAKIEDPTWHQHFEARYGVPCTPIDETREAFSKRGLNLHGRTWCIEDVVHPAFVAMVPESRVDELVEAAHAYDFDVADRPEAIMHLRLWEQTAEGYNDWEEGGGDWQPPMTLEVVVRDEKAFEAGPFMNSDLQLGVRRMRGEDWGASEYYGTNARVYEVTSRGGEQFDVCAAIESQPWILEVRPAA